MLCVHLELLDEPLIGVDLSSGDVYLVSFALHHLDHFAEGALVLLEQVGHDNGHAATHSRHAVHQHVGLPPCRIDELERLVEVPVELVVRVVLGRDVQVEGDVLLGVVKPARAGDRQNSPDVKFCLMGVVLWRRGTLVAAMKLLMKMEPLPVMLSNTHSTSAIRFIANNSILASTSIFMTTL